MGATGAVELYYLWIVEIIFYLIAALNLPCNRVLRPYALLASTLVTQICESTTLNDEHHSIERGGLFQASDDVHVASYFRPQPFFTIENSLHDRTTLALILHKR